jgi:hypothetical protein
MYGTRDAPQIWREVVAEVMMRLGFKASLHHPSIAGEMLVSEPGWGMPRKELPKRSH